MRLYLNFMVHFILTQIVYLCLMYLFVFNQKTLGTAFEFFYNTAPCFILFLMVLILNFIKISSKFVTNLIFLQASSFAYLCTLMLFFGKYCDDKKNLTSYNWTLFFVIYLVSLLLLSYKIRMLKLSEIIYLGVLTIVLFLDYHYFNFLYDIMIMVFNKFDF